jgi:hypothetical protein
MEDGLLDGEIKKIKFEIIIVDSELSWIEK